MGEQSGVSLIALFGDFPGRWMKADIDIPAELVLRFPDCFANRTLSLGTVRGQAKTLPIRPAGVMQLGQSPPNYVPVGDYEAPFPYRGDLESATVEFGG